MGDLSAAYARGVLGAAALSAISAIGRRAGLLLDLELLLGTFVGLPPGRPAHLLGQVLQLANGGLLGCGYRVVFDALRLPRTASVGAALGTAHGTAAGLSLALAPLMHPQIPDRIPPPGAFMLAYGRREAAVFFLMHVLFGAIQGFSAERVDP